MALSRHTRWNASVLGWGLGCLVGLAGTPAAAQTSTAPTSTAQTSQTGQTSTAVSQPESSQQSQSQAPPPPSQPAPSTDISRIPLSFDRIREGVRRKPLLKIDFLDPNTPIYRISVQERALTLEDRWKVRDNAVASYVGPSFGSAWHHEFLSMVTPKQQIAASPFGIFGNPMHPVGTPVLAIGKAIQRAWQNRQRDEIRRQIQEELKALDPNYQPPASQPPPP